jgi:hypothetical protein
VPTVEWRKKWDGRHDPFRGGRVLVVDCLSREKSDDGRRKTHALEFGSLEELEAFYETGVSTYSVSKRRNVKEGIPYLREEREGTASR